MLTEYFKRVSEEIRNDWNVELYLSHFGTGQSNEGTAEAKVIKRYYVEPHDKRFRQIYLNFNKSRNIESIVWFFNIDHKMSLGQLKDLFGSINIHNVIYDETTDVEFIKKPTDAVHSISTTILEWVKQRQDRTLYYIKENKEIGINDDYEVLNLTMSLNKAR